MWIFRNWTISAEKRTFRCLTRNSSGCGLLWSLVVVLTGVGLLIGNRNFAEGTRTLWWLNVHPLSSVPGHPGVQLQRLTRSHPCPCIGQSVCHSVRGMQLYALFCVLPMAELPLCRACCVSGELFIGLPSAHDEVLTERPKLSRCWVRSVFPLCRVLLAYTSR